MIHYIRLKLVLMLLGKPFIWAVREIYAKYQMQKKIMDEQQKLIDELINEVEGNYEIEEHYVH